MNLYDISVSIRNGMAVYPGDPPVAVEPVNRIERGDPDNLTRLQLATHTGTHVDAPRHFLRNGISVDRLPLETLLGSALVVEITGVREITRDVLARLPLKNEKRLLLKTDNSAFLAQGEFIENYTHLGEDGARFLVERGIRLVGIDYLSIERFHGTGDVHRLLLESGVVILESLNLQEVPPGEYELICLPLKVAGGDGAPARAVLRSVKHPGDGGDFDPHTSKWPLA